MPHYLITAGPTREPIDRVRFISNRSSGRMGVRLAEAAHRSGHEVTLIAGPGVIVDDLPDAVAVVRIESTADLEAAIAEQFPTADVLVMAAAVSDYRPAQVVEGKLPRQADGTLTLTLSPTPDVVAGAAAMRKPGQRVIAFALEAPEHLEARAAGKLKRKGADAIVANPLETMEGDSIRATWLDATGGREALPAQPKAAFATWLIARIDAM